MLLKRIKFKLYSIAILNEIKIRYLLLGFENVNTRVSSLDKRLIIPVLRKFGARIGKNCDIESPLIINAKENYDNLSVGDNCYLGKNVVLDIKGKITIRNNAIISMSSTILSHIDLSISKVRVIYPALHQETTLEDHCYIGAASCILPGVKIGEASVVGAGSLITKDVPAHSVVAGVAPARELRKIEV